MGLREERELCEREYEALLKEAGCLPTQMSHRSSRKVVNYLVQTYGIGWEYMRDQLGVDSRKMFDISMGSSILSVGRLWSLVDMPMVREEAPSVLMHNAIPMREPVTDDDRELNVLYSKLMHEAYPDSAIGPVAA